MLIAAPSALEGGVPRRSRRPVGALSTLDSGLSTLDCSSEPEMPGGVHERVGQSGGGNSLPVSVGVSVEDAGEGGQNCVSPIRHGSVMQMRRPEYDRGDQ